MVSNSSRARVLSFIHMRGDTFKRTLVFTKAGAPIDITGIIYKMTVRGRSMPDVLTFEFGNGFTKVDVNKLQMLKTATEMKIPAGAYRYDIQQTIDDVVTTIIRGSFIIEQDETV